MSATAELNYQNFDARNNAGVHMSGNSLSQKYSLLYKKNDNILSNRFGTYDIALGYEWATFDTTVKSTAGGHDDFGSSRGHILFRGDVLINPKEMPLKLNVYSRDMNPINFSTFRTYTQNPSFTGGFQNLREPYLTSGIDDGLHLESGATLVIGVKNGMTNGYNEILRHFPMLLVDYKDLINKDTRSESPVDNRFTRLAFVSLNKKENWFHYRLFNYTDYLDHRNDYRETQFQLGTVDHALQRRWIDFSNWISVSADGQYTRRENSYIGGESYTEFDLNLFGVARRSSWELTTFNNFNRRYDDSGLLTYHTSVPVSLNGVYSPDVSWSSRFSYNKSSNNQNARFEDLTGSYRVDGFKRSLFTLSHQLSAESATTESRNLFNIRGSLETASTPRFSRKLSFDAAYTATSYNSRDTKSTFSMFEQALRASAIYVPTETTRITLRQNLNLARGSATAFESLVRDTSLLTSQYSNPRGDVTLNGNSFQSVTSLTAAWNPMARLNTDLSGSFDYFSPEQGLSSVVASAYHNIAYTAPGFRIHMRNMFNYDDSHLGQSSRSYLNDSGLDYTFNRSLNATLGFWYNRSFSNSSNTENYNFYQTLNYSLYKVNGVIRKLAEITQTASHNQTYSNYATTTSPRESYFGLGLKYYPFRQLTLGAGGRYTFYTKLDDYLISYYGQMAFSYRLLQASIDYTYGKRKSDGLLEKKLTANFKKTF